MYAGRFAKSKATSTQLPSRLKVEAGTSRSASSFNTANVGVNAPFILTQKRSSLPTNDCECATAMRSTTLNRKPSALHEGTTCISFGNPDASSAPADPQRYRFVNFDSYDC